MYFSSIVYNPKKKKQFSIIFKKYSTKKKKKQGTNYMKVPNKKKTDLEMDKGYEG
jgi:hypothetical protein